MSDTISENAENPEHECAPISPLVADLVSGMFEANHATTTTLIDSLTADNASLRARIDAIREGILSLLDGPYAPSAAEITRCLYPSDEAVQLYMKDVISASPASERG